MRHHAYTRMCTNLVRVTEINNSYSGEITLGFTNACTNVSENKEFLWK